MISYMKMKHVVFVIVAMLMFAWLLACAAFAYDDIDFSNVVMIGDSQTGSMYRYNARTPFLPQDNFRYTNGLSICRLVSDIKSYLGDSSGGSYKDIVTKTEADIICLMFGLNDMEHSSDKCAPAWENVINYLKQEHPDTIIVVQSVTPVTKAHRFNNKDIQHYNQELALLCTKLDVEYIDICDGLYDDVWNLKDEYSFDGIHLNEAGTSVWRENLKEALAKRYYTVDQTSTEEAEASGK